MPTELPSPPPGSTPGALLAFDAKTGVPLWQVQAPMAELSHPLESSGMVYLSGGYGGPSTVLAAFNARNGGLLWAAPTPVPCGWPNTVAVGSAIVLTAGCTPPVRPPAGHSSVHGLEPKTGRELWTAEGISPAVGTGPALILTEAANGFKVHGLNPLTGQQLWEAKLTSTNIPPLVNGQVALVQQTGCPTATNPPDITASSCPGPGQARSFVSRLDLSNGGQLWQTGFGQGGQVRRLLLGDVAVFSVDVELPPPPGQPPSSSPPPGAIGAIDPATGQELWRQTVMTELSVPALAVPGTVFVEQIKPSGASNQCPTTRLDALESRSGTLRWRVDTQQACEITVESDGQAVVVVLTTLSGTKIVVLDSATGTERWEKPMATSGTYPPVQATVSGGVVFVAASGHFVAPSGGGD